MKCLLGICGIVLCATLAHGADVNELIKQLKEGDNDTRRAAAKALAEGGPESKEAVPALIKALKDQDAFVRRFSAQALGEIGPDARTASSALAMALNDPRKEVQSAAARALGKLGPAGVEALIALVKDERKDSSARRQAIDALSQGGKDAHAAVPVLTELVKEKPVVKGKNKKNPNAPEDLRVDAANALGTIATPDDKETVEALQSLADKKSKASGNLKRAANMALRKIRGTRK
jgi:HEAT repeat protein